MTHLPRPYLVWFLSFMYIISCTKHTYEEFPVPHSPKQWIGSWKIAVFKITDGEVLLDSLLLSGPCIYDNYYLFHANGTYSYEDGIDLCGSDAQSPLRVGTWKLLPDETVLIWDDIHWYVEYWSNTMIKIYTFLPITSDRAGCRLDLILTPY